MQSHGGFVFCSVLLYLLHLISGDEECVLGNLHHRGVVDGIGIEIVDYRVGVHLLEAVNLFRAEAEVDYVRVAVGARADVVLDVESVHDLVEQYLGARGDYHVIILPLAEIEGLYLVDIRIPELGHERIEILYALVVLGDDIGILLKRFLGVYRALCVFVESAENVGNVLDERRVFLKKKDKQVKKAFAVVDRVVKIVNIHFHFLLVREVLHTSQSYFLL